MRNQEVAKIFYAIADFLKMEDVDFKPAAYQKAAIVLESLDESLDAIYARGGKKALEDLPGIGKSMAEKIEEYIKTGKIGYYEDLKKKTPIDIGDLTAVEGLGPRRAKKLYQELGIRSLDDLEKAARSHKIAKIEGFREKTEGNILEGIEFLKRSKGRFLLGDILPRVKTIQERLSRLKEVERIDAGGSVRRKKETIGDVDFLIISKEPKKVMDFFVSQPEAVKVWGKGPTKASIRVKEGFDIDLRVVPKNSYGAALQYFTGSKEHNIATRRIAMAKNLKLSEYGLFKGKRMVAGWDEEGVYKSLGLVWVEPELREDRGEIEAALRQAQGKAQGLPRIIGYDDIRGDLHCHSSWNGGSNNLEELADAAQKMKYEYLGISDHTKFLRIEKGLDEKKLGQRDKEIDKLNEKFKVQGLKFRLLKGCEANILNDGSVDIKDEALKKLDYVIAGIHSNFKMSESEMTERMIKAIKNPNVDIISHPTGRILKRRDEYQIDLDKILRAAKEFNVVLEINSYPERLDLNDINIRRAKESGVKMVINTDSHQKDQLRFMELGISQARRGWAEKEDVINTHHLEKLMKYFKH
ncbi:MAG: DNA polymerase/3'-5' exonuclease PolX [Candidatus Pacebacteria bacterium]|nr:DNA polymerase/3'-5' exonuclease PolX [Candidatus Paceibacterota bacterium]